MALAFRSFGALIERESEGWSRLEAGRPARQNGVREGGDEDACARAPKPKPILPLAPMLMNLPASRLSWEEETYRWWRIMLGMGTLFYALLCYNNGVGFCTTEDEKIEMGTLTTSTL